MAAAEERMKKINEKLNFLSSKFDPLTALYNSKLQPPVPNIHVFNNLLEYTNAIREGKIKPSEYKPSESHCSSTEAASRTRNLKPEYKQDNNKKLKERLKAMSESGGSGVGGAKLDKKRGGRIDDAKLKEFLLVEETFKAKQTAKKRMNVMQKMEAYTEGPHSLLLKCISERRRVRVWTRRYKGLRSVLAGYLVAFDKHMNMALLDVDEVYTIEQRINQEANGVSPSSKTTKRKKKKKTKAVLGNELPCELAGTVEISLPTSALDTGELDLCTKEGKRGRSSDRNSPKGFLPVQPITSKQSSKESVSTCKKEHCQISASGNDVAASSDCATITDLPLNGNESMLPSAQSLSIALRASVSGVDGDLLQLTEVRLTDTVLDNATELETVMGQNDCSLATREENRASNTSWNAKIIEKIKKDKQESNKLANREGFDNKERETGDVKDLNSCSFSNADSGDVSNAIINNNTKQGQGLQFRTKGSCLSPNGMELFRDNEIADYHTSMPIENSQQLMAIGKEDKFIKIPDTERSWDSQHDAHEKSLLQMDAETHKIDIKDLCHFRENCLNKKDFVVCCSEKDDSSNSDIVTFLRSSSIVSTKAVASFSTKGETVMHSAETQLNERASTGSCKHANLAHYSADYEFIRSETSLCRGPVSSASCFALCSEGAIVIPNEVRKEPGSPSKPKIETTSIDAQFSEVVSNTEEHSISRYHEGKEDKCLFHKKDQHDLELASCATELQDDELQEDYHSITQVTQMFFEPKEDGASVKLEDLEKVPHDALKHENSAQDILENSNTASSSSETNSPFCNFLSITGEIADLKNEQAPLHSFRDGVNINPGQKEAHNETSSIKGDENNCQSLKTGEVTGEKRTNKKTFKNDDNSNEFIECNPHKEGGEISSVEDYGLTPSEKSKNEEKEEGELSSSDSGDDSLPVKHCDTNDGKNVQGDNRLTKEDKQALPHARTDSSRDFPNKLIDERSNSRREYSSHAVQSAGLRRKLHESRKKKFPSTSKANSSKETSNLRVQNGSRSEKAAKKNNCIKKQNRDELLTEGQKHGKAQSSGTKDKRRNFIQSSQRQECKTEEKWKFLDKQNEKPSNSSQDAKKIKKRSESKSEIKSRRNIRSPRETDKIVPNKVELHQVSKRKETKKLRTPEDAAVDKDSREETQHSKAITCTKAKTTLHHQIVETGTKSARPLSRQSEETLLRRTLSVDNFGSRKHVETKQGNTISHSTHCLEQSKTGNFSKREDEAKTTTTDIGKLNISGKRKTTPSKTASRVTTRNTPKKSLTANKRRTKPLNSSENPLQNPRKRIRPTESTEKWQTKKSRVDKQRNSSTTADTIEPNMSTKIVQCNTVKNGEIFYIKVKDSGNQMNPDKLEYFQLNKTEHNCQNNPTIKSVATRAEPILFGRNKCLVFKRRHVNQLFIRGDNVVMVGYAE